MSEKRYDNPYEANETMRLLGHQCVLSIYDEAKDDLEDIMSARPYTVTFETALNILMLGYIHGKRAERRRKKRDAEKSTVVPMCIQLSEKSSV